MAKQSEVSRFVERQITARFPSTIYGGKTGPCRLIDCIHKPCDYSQHSWGNALDIYGPGGSSSTTDQAYMDRIFAFLDVNRKSMNIRVLLWRVRNHYGHIHADFWPHGENKPMCAGASTNTWRYADGKRIYAATAPMSSIGAISEAPPPAANKPGYDPIKGIGTKGGLTGLKRPDPPPPLPELDIGIYGDYQKFFYPQKGKG